MPSDLPETIGPYRVRELLGKAGQSAVFTVSNPQGRPAAVKLFSSKLGEDPVALERFHREIAAIIPTSRHPNLVHLLESGEDGGRPYLAMELVEGPSLDRVLKQRRVSLPEAFTVMRGICRGLAHAHQHDLVHRALTPRNVLVTPDFSVVKVADLGVTGFESIAPSLTATLSTGEIRLGALYYLAPETLDGRSSVDARADLYSAGVIFHEMLTGRTPGPKFGLPSQFNPELPSEVDAVVLKCLARRPDERYMTAAELLAAVERLEESLRLRVLTEIRGISQAGSRLLGGTGSETGGKKTWLYVGIAVVVIVLAVAGYLALR
ncbi:MAG TPA: serine/threonine-protein kinase [Thermoanaerobaculia bacterium]|jgi:serine/threonine-protein kinase|nr:serine/threonine-protein kinase [Thermoanaerobaculia bacterium]